MSISSCRHFFLQLPAELVVGSVVHELTSVAETAKTGLLVIFTNVRSVIPPDGGAEMRRSALRPCRDLGGRPVDAVFLFDEFCVVVDAAVGLVLEVDGLLALVVSQLSFGVDFFRAFKNGTTILKKEIQKLSIRLLFRDVECHDI
jgi:hypothetical protein